MRLNKYLAACGVASRRKCDEIIRAGQIRINGETGDFTGVQIDPEKDTVEYQGRKIALSGKKIYILLNKPSGCVSTCSDDKGRETVLQIIGDVGERLYPVGRLDCDTEGLLILTNDGDLAFRLTHPRHETEKKYFVRFTGIFDAAKKKHLEGGVLLDGKPTSPARVTLLKSSEKNHEITIAIHEGRNRQVRRMLEALGLAVAYLKRVSVGSLGLGDLKPGEYRDLTPEEVDYLYKISGQPAHRPSDVQTGEKELK